MEKAPVRAHLLCRVDRVDKRLQTYVPVHFLFTDVLPQHALYVLVAARVLHLKNTQGIRCTHTHRHTPDGVKAVLELCYHWVSQTSD